MKQCILIFALFAQTVFATTPYKIMLLTGQSSKYHDWTKTAPVIRTYLEETKLFAVDVVTSPAMGADMSEFSPKFSEYAAVVMVYEGDEWPATTKTAFEAYIKNGGGLVTIHDTDNAFPYWKEWNEMIGVGGWGFKLDGNIGARDEKAGPMIRWRDGKMVIDETSPGTTSHPPRADFVIDIRDAEHPITQGMPSAWLHANDEIYSRLRGPAKNVTVLATAHADKAKNLTASGEHEPMLMTIQYGKGRVFHNTLGHVSPKDQPPFLALDCIGFKVTVQRGTEWAATGNVTQKLPENFPTKEKVSVKAP